MLEAIDETYRELGGTVLGIVPDEIAAGSTANAEREEGLIRLLIDLRAEARKAKDFAKADQIRNQLAELGVTLEDRPMVRSGAWIRQPSSILCSGPFNPPLPGASPY